MELGKTYKIAAFIAVINPLVSCSNNEQLADSVFSMMNNLINSSEKFKFQRSYDNIVITEIYSNDISITTEEISNVNITYTVRTKQQDNSYLNDVFTIKEGKDLSYERSYIESATKGPYSSIGSIKFTGFNKKNYSSFTPFDDYDNAIEAKDSKNYSHVFLVDKLIISHMYDNSITNNHYFNNEVFTKLDDNYVLNIPKVFIDLKAEALA